VRVVNGYPHVARKGRDLMSFRAKGEESRLRNELKRRDASRRAQHDIRAHCNIRP